MCSLIQRFKTNLFFFSSPTSPPSLHHSPHFSLLLFQPFRITGPRKSSLTPCLVIWSRFSIMIFPLLKMILILNDTAHCWENETSVAASPFECPCEFIKSTSFPRSNSDLHSCTSVKEYSRTKVFNVEQNAISISLFGFIVFDNEPSQLFIMWKR